MDCNHGGGVDENKSHILAAKRADIGGDKYYAAF